ncbi:serine protease inhibitor 27A-like [Eurosta solidaginis]|uniref:serine protease inhibitor 27A-like n=1 Tax=Eurosta solidaginis TaxID=178769 RepID=UPI0035317DAD
MTQRSSLILLFAIVNALHITHTHPTEMSNHTKYTLQTDKIENAHNKNNNLANQIYDIPAGIFTTTYTHLPADFKDDVSDADDYVPYASDVYDRFSWALMKQILMSIPIPTTHRHNNLKSDAVDSFFGADRENVIFSPFSVKLVLALLTEATGNGTCAQSQLLNTLGDIKSIENLRGFYRKTLTSLKQVHSHYTLRLESRLYTDTTVKPLSTYSALLQSVYETPIEQLNFANSVDAATEINSWITRATEGRLQQLVTDEGLAHSVMLLVNAIYFNGSWRRQFRETYPGIFFRTSRIQLSASYMELTDTFYYYQCNDLRARIIRLPYRGQKFSMFVVLPNEGQSVDALMRRMQNEQLKHMQFMMERTKLRVALPKFKFDHKTDLKAALCRLGVVDIFTEKAELTVMVENRDSRLMVTNILQKSGIDVNEHGTEAYAATEVEIVNRFGGSEYIEEFIVNRPFLFFIEEERAGNILFAGKVKNPTL